MAALQKRQHGVDASGALRASLRQKMYDHCSTVQTSARIVYCDAPVGSGKTTAVMAYLLNIAERLGLRHIIVVVPYINIISQAVKVYREALALDGEDPRQIVAEYHHQTDYESIELRHLASTWSAPIIVTTAVQFFESLASNIPSKLRKIHQLPGSAVLIDESHAALPASMMPLSWIWMQELAANWGCHFCLCSGTTVEYWKTDSMREISTTAVEPLLSLRLSEQLEAFESNRIKCNFAIFDQLHFSGADELMRFIVSKDGPRLVVMNTVMSAAVLALHMRNAGMNVLHLSTALTPNDREAVLKEVRLRLEKHGCNQDWTLVATSCVECGLDLSFRNGFCELRSLQSALQLSGRVSRNSEYADACLYCFTVSDSSFSRNSMFEPAIKALKELIASDALNHMTISESITLSFDMECKNNGGLRDTLLKNDRRCNFVRVAESFRMIAQDTVTVIADDKLIRKMESGEAITALELMKGSVNTRKSLLKKLETVKILGSDELYGFTEGQYDCFVGYVRGLIKHGEKYNV